MANRPTQRSMQDLLEKQLVSLNEIHGTLAASKLIELGQLVEEKKALDDDNILVDELRDMRLISNAILESLNKIKDKFLAMPITTNEEKAETAKSNAAMLKALQDLGKDKKEPLKDIKEGLSLGPIISGIGISLASLGGLIGAYVKNIKFWIDLLTPEKLFQKFKKFDKNFEKVIAEIIGGFKSAFSKSFKSIFESKPLQSFFDIFNKIIDFVKKPFVSTSLDKFNRFFGNQREPLLTRLIEPFMDAFKIIKDLISGPVGKVKGIFTGIGEVLGKFTKMFTSVFGIVGKLMLPVTILMTAWDTVKGAIEGYEQGGIIGAIQGAVEGLFKSLFVAPLDMLREAVAWIAGKLGFENVQKQLESFTVEDVFEDIMDSFYVVIDLVSNTLKSVANGFLTLVSDFYGLFAGLGIPEVTIPLPDVLGGDKKIGPFYPYKAMSEDIASMKMEVTEPKTFKELKADRKAKRVEVEKVKKEKDLEEKSKEINPVEQPSETKATDEFMKKPVANMSAEDLKKRAIILSEQGKDFKDEPEMVARFEQLKQGTNAEAITPKPTDIVSNAEAITPKTADVVAAKTTATEVAKEDAIKSAGNTVVSAPTVNTSNSTVNSTAVRLPSRNPDSTSSRYISSCYAIN